MLRRRVILLLVLILVLVLIPNQALADEGEQKCGENAYWSFENGTLTISGSGPMYDFRELQGDTQVFRDRPWDGFTQEIRYLVVEEGITWLGSDSFLGLSNLESAELPDSLTGIGNFAFYGCENLASVNLPAYLETLGQQAFSDCRSLESIEIPASVSWVDAGVFMNCSSLTDVLFRSNPDLPGFGLGNSVFQGCTMLEEIRVEDGHIGLQSIDGALYFYWWSGELALNDYPAGKKNSELRIPENTVFINQSAVYSNPHLETVIFPSSVQSIDNMAFGSCRRLNTLIFEGSVPIVDDNVFWGCNATLRYPCGDETWTEARNTWDTEAIFGWQGSVTWDEYHVSFEENVIAPTCTEPGCTVHTCTKCGYSYTDGHVDASGHSFGDWVVLQEPADGEAGLWERTCTACGHTETKVIPLCYGDANGDKEVNGKDLILLRQRMAGWEIVLDEAAADCNCDGELNGKDLILLRQKLAGWGVVLGPTPEEDPHSIVGNWVTVSRYDYGDVAEVLATFMHFNADGTGTYNRGAWMNYDFALDCPSDRWHPEPMGYPTFRFTYTLEGDRLCVTYCENEEFGIEEYTEVYMLTWNEDGSVIMMDSCYRLMPQKNMTPEDLLLLFGLDPNP